MSSVAVMFNSTGSLISRLSAHCWRAWYIFSHDSTYLRVGRDRSKDGCTSLPSAGDIVSALSLWHKRAPKSSYKKYRFVAFLHCLITTAVLTLLPSFYPTYHTREKIYQAHSCSKVKHARGPENEAVIQVIYLGLVRYLG